MWGVTNGPTNGEVGTPIHANAPLHGLFLILVISGLGATQAASEEDRR